MNDHNTNALDSLIEAALGQDSKGAAELDQLAADLGIDNGAAFGERVELAAAAVMVNSVAKATEEMPAQVKDKIRADIATRNTDSNVVTLDTTSSRTTERSGVAQYLGWACAAALLLALVIRPDSTTVPEDPADTPKVVTTAESRDSLKALAGTVTLAWNPPEIDGYESVTGDVVWNNELQQGYMRLANMPVNDPSVAQYQLWIVDPDRDSNPIDGGVFDIVADSGEILIPIDAKLSVLDPQAFAITKEQPGGVVVSGGPLLVVAAAT
ncbi:MAG: anti-sigma factor [Pseudomonadota bacterium]